MVSNQTDQLALALDCKLQSALSLHQQGFLAEAEVIYHQILLVEPQHFEALQLLGTVAAQRKNFEDAVALFDQALSVKPNHPGTHNNRGKALFEMHRYAEALKSYDQATVLNPDYSDAYSNRGNAFLELKRYDDAIQSYNQALASDPHHFRSLNNRGNALLELKRYAGALQSYDQAIAVKPDYSDAYSNRGNAFLELKRYAEALQSYERAIALKPDYSDAYSNRGNAFLELKRYAEALQSYDQAIALKPDFPDTYSNRGNAFFELKLYAEAVQSYDQAIALKPDYADAYSNRGSALLELGCYEDAIESYERAITLNPYGVFWFGMCLHAKMRICSWSNFETHCLQLVQKIERHEKVSTPFPMLAILDSPLLQKKASMIYVEEICTSLITLPKIPKRPRHDKLCIGYYSADFHDHATTNLMAGLFENHDKSKFEIIAFSFGPDKPNSGMRERITKAFDQFIDVRTKTEKDIALLSRDLGVDIAIDLKGFTQDSRAGIFGLRAAPIQVNYLGYPGTMGAECIDYIIADSTLIPEKNQQFYTEKIVYLPESYQVNDAKRQISDKVFTKEELGLPETGFIFCCFNNNFKITPSVFDCWMRILKRVLGSVLWLLEDNPEVAGNLKREALQRGIDKERLIFAKRMPLPEHLARHRMADLFLDTLPCNAHTTASDALWAGLPVLTFIGESFASRVAASLLNAIHLPELVTTSAEEYEALAVKLASNPKKLQAIKKKLLKYRLSSPLFDTRLFTRHLEEAYTVMYEKYQSDLLPEHISINTKL